MARVERLWHNDHNRAANRCTLQPVTKPKPSRRDTSRAGQGSAALSRDMAGNQISILYLPDKLVPMFGEITCPVAGPISDDHVQKQNSLHVIVHKNNQNIEYLNNKPKRNILSSSHELRYK